jgi:oligopeptidase B
MSPLRRRLSLSAVVSLALVAIGVAAPAAAGQDPSPPVAPIIPKVDTLHGEIRTDNYFWLRHKSDPRVISYLEQENAYTAAKMKHTEPLQQRLYA